MKLNINTINLLKAERGLTNGDISKLCDISRPWLSTVFNSQVVSPKVASKLSKGLDIDLKELIIFEE